MDESRIKALLDQAAAHYNDGLYDEAIASWRQVLESEPSNQKAREGIRMASLLNSDSGSTETKPGEDESAVATRIDEGIERVRELAANGQFTEALEGCDLLAEIAPHHPQVRKLGHEIRLAVRGAGISSVGGAPASAGPNTLEHHLATARQALADGQDAVAAGAARAALQLDPANMEACGILSMVDEDASKSVPLEIGEAPAESSQPFEREAAHSDTQPQAADESLEVGERISTLLESGQTAFDAGRFQEAVDIWSRVFAIDLTNADAGHRIDGAKAALEEQARQIDHLYYQAVDANEANNLEEALRLFEQVLSISPTHPEAHAFVEEINLRLGGLGEPIQVNHDAAREAEQEKASRSAAAETLFEGSGSVPLSRPVADSPYPPRAAAGPRVESRPAPARDREDAPKKGKRGGMVAGVVGALAVAGIGVGAWLWFGSDPGSMPEARATVLATAPQAAPSKPPAAPPRVTATPQKAAPQNTAPIEVIPGAPAKQPEPAPQKVDLEMVQQQADELERQGRQYFQQKKWAESVLAFRKSMSSDPVGFDSQDTLDKAMAELERQAKIEREMEESVKALKQNDYATALQKFYRLQQDNPGMKVLDTYIRNSWFNWGLSLLIEGEAGEAAKRFKEVLDIDPSDREASKAAEVAKRYEGRSPDAVYDAFVSALKPRVLDQD